MKAIILAAGRGRRFTKDHSIDHKSLLKINNLSLIERQIKILQKYGIVEIWVVIGHNSVKAGLRKNQMITMFQGASHHALAFVSAINSVRQIAGEERAARYIGIADIPNNVIL